MLSILKIALVVFVAAPWFGQLLVAQSASADDPLPALVPGQPDALRLPAALVRSLQLQTAPAAVARPRSLILPGTLALDSNRVSRVVSPCTGEVVQIGMVLDHTAKEPSATRELRVGDRVRRGDLLAVIWSRELGEKKNDLLDALAQLHLERQKLAEVEEGAKKGTFPEAVVLQTRYQAKASLLAVDRAERRLLLWRLPDADLKAVKAEAERLAQGEARRQGWAQEWARVEMRAPRDGTLLEKNATVGEVVGTARSLFRVADLDRLAVLAEVPEQELAALRALPPDLRRWQVRPRSDRTARPLQALIDHIGPILDTKKQTALAWGTVDNAKKQLLAGQAVTAAVDLPPGADEVAVPASAVTEEAGVAVVFVQADPTQPVYAKRRVVLVTREAGVVHLRSKLHAGEYSKGLQPVRAGELIVTTRAAELRASLKELLEKKN